MNTETTDVSEPVLLDNLEGLYLIEVLLIRTGRLHEYYDLINDPKWGDNATEIALEAGDLFHFSENKTKNATQKL